MKRAGLVALLSCALAPGVGLAEEATSCQDRLQVMQRRIESVPRHLSLPASPTVQLLPEVSAGRTVVLPGPIVDIGGGRVAMEGEVAPLAKPQPVLDRLAALAAREQDAKAEVSAAYLRIDANQPLGPARKLVCRIAAQRPIRLVVRDPRRGVPMPYQFPPAPAPWRNVLDKIDVITDPVERSKALSKALRTAMGRCPDLRDAFTSLIREPALLRVVRLSDRLLKAATRCQCKDFDVDGLESVVLRILASTGPARSYLEAPKACEAWPKNKGLRGQDLAERWAEGE